MEYLGFMITLAMVSSQVVTGLRQGAEREHISRREGQNLTLECSFSKEGYQVFINPVVWVKVIGDGGDDVEINNNVVIKPPFAATGRYSLKPAFPVTGISLDLVIDDIEVVDNGTYRCVMEGEGALPPIEYTVSVPVRLDDLSVKTTKVTMNGSKMTYEFTAREPTSLSCESTGGNPQPTLTISRGDQIITSEFDLEVDEERTGPRGLERVTHIVKRVNPTFSAEPDMSGQELKCAAKFHRLPDLRQSVKGIIDVKYAPEFDCQSYRFLKLPIDIENYVIDCVIKGNPPVETQDVFWTFKGDNETVKIPMGQVHDSYVTNSSLTEDNHLNVTLKITGVNETHFNTYHIQAGNEVSQEHFEIYFGEATTTTSTTTTTTTKPTVVKPEPGPEYRPEVEANISEGAGNSVHVTGSQVFLCAALAYLLQLLGSSAQR